MFKKVCLFYFLVILIFNQGKANVGQKGVEKNQAQWVDSVFNSLNETQRLGQLFNIAAYSNQSEKQYAALEKIIAEYNVGGLTFFQGGPVRQATLTNRYQAVAPTPLLIAMDAETGVGMRLDSVFNFPKQLTLGAIENEDIVYAMGKEIAYQFHRLGMHVNFAPVVDINSNPNNPVIGNRSFGENRNNVSIKGIAYMKGLQDNGIIASAKHFPGHGDTGTDSHYELPVLHHDKERMDAFELYPFKQLIKDSLMSTMVAHLGVPAYDKTPNKASTLSSPIVTDLLRKELGFDGLVFTDALNMKAVSKHYKPGEVDVLALRAGNDVLLLSEDVPEAIKRIKHALKTGVLKQEAIDGKVKKILRSKYWAGLAHYEPVILDNLVSDLNRPEAQAIKFKLYQEAITLVKDEGNMLPLQALDTLNFASLSIGSETTTLFQQTLANYAPFAHYNLPDGKSDEQVYNTLFSRLKHYKMIVVGFHRLNNAKQRNYGLDKEDILFLRALQAQHVKVVAVVFGNPYALTFLEDINTVLCAYENDDYAQIIAPQVIFGALESSGRLPVSASINIRVGMGESIKPNSRLAYAFPEHVGMSSATLQEIDKIVTATIQDEATPGAQVLVARNGVVVFNKAYGYQTYDSLIAVTPETIYDVASITKVAATLQAIMFLEGRGLLDLEGKVSTYLPELQNTNKKDIIVKDVLLHQAGLRPYIPFWQKTVDEFGVKPDFYSDFQQPNFAHQVAYGLYAHNALADSLWKWTINSELRTKKKKKDPYDYKYSDLGFYILQRVAEKLLNQSMDSFLEQNFYTPLGLSTMDYLPLCRFPIEKIAPTERDTYFRNELVCGMVHDQGAAIAGGIAGHAGIFSNANDLAILMQMNLQNGYYGGDTYLPKGTVDKFNQTQNSENRRGLGWDKPALDSFFGPTSQFASPKAFGHTGFTGTAVWADPEFNLIYIFLSNRVYPDAGNAKLIQNNIRTRIQDVVYQAMWDYEKYHY